jgi:hypothetical protein
MSDAAKSRRRRRAGFAAALLVALACTASASAELTQHGNLFIRFNGGIVPQALPRDTLAPVSVGIEGTIRTLEGEEPPALREISIAVNRAGHLDRRGLPRCHRRQIELATSAQALAVCGDALVGTGGIVAESVLENQPPTTLRGGLLLFNSAQQRRPAILGHFYQARPVPARRIILFEMRRTSGTFGWVLTAHFTSALDRAYLRSIFLRLGRNYTFRGDQRAYLSAACSAPAGFPGATFPFARASMTFEDGRTLSSTLIRSCKVKGP